MSQKWLIGHFLEFCLSDQLDIAYSDKNECCETFGKVARLWGIIQKSLKCIFEWFKMPEKRFVAIFLMLGLLDRLDIAYCDNIKPVLTFGNLARSWRIIQKWEKCIFRWFKKPKRVLLLFSQLWFVGSTWYCKMWIIKKSQHHLLMIQRAKKRF